MPNVTAGYGRLSDLMRYFNVHILLHVRNVVTSSNLWNGQNK